MSALPVDDAIPDLPFYGADEIKTRDLVTIRDLAVAYDTTRDAVRALLARPGAPAPVGLTAAKDRNRHHPLYQATDIDRFINAADGGDGTIARRRRSSPVRVIGTATPTAGRGYTWRDPDRQPVGTSHLRAVPRKPR